MGDSNYLQMIGNLTQFIEISDMVDHMACTHSVTTTNISK